MKRYQDCPQILRDFLTYHETIKGQSPRTISEYYLDLRMFLRFIKLMRNDMPIHSRLDDIDIRDVTIDFIREITTSDIFDFLSYLANDRTPNPDSSVPDYGIAPAARARKLSAYNIMAVSDGTDITFTWDNRYAQPWTPEAA